MEFSIVNNLLKSNNFVICCQSCLSPLMQVGICRTITSSAPFSASLRALCILLSKEVFLNSESFFLVNLQVLDIGCGIGGPLREIARFR